MTMQIHANDDKRNGLAKFNQKIQRKKTDINGCKKEKKLYVQEIHKIFCFYRKQCHIKKK